jgi:hypothetical protein
LAERNSGGNNSNSGSKGSGSQSKSSGSQSKSGGSQSKSGGSQSKSSGSQSNSRRKKVNPADLARAAVQTVSEFTGRRPESVLGLQRDGDGWRVAVEVVELTRVPSSTDVLAAYVVTLDEDGEVVGYERRRRYQRAQVGSEEG